MPHYHNYTDYSALLPVATGGSFPLVRAIDRILDPLNSSRDEPRAKIHTTNAKLGFVQVHTNSTCSPSHLVLAFSLLTYILPSPHCTHLSSARSLCRKAYSLSALLERKKSRSSIARQATTLHIPASLLNLVRRPQPLAPALILSRLHLARGVTILPGAHP